MSKVGPTQKAYDSLPSIAGHPGKRAHASPKASGTPGQEAELVAGLLERGAVKWI